MSRVWLVVLLLISNAHATFQPITLSSGIGAPTNATTTFYGAVQGYAVVSATRTDRQQKVPAFRPTRVSCVASTALSAGSTWTLTLELNGVDTDWVCAMTDASTTCEDTTGSGINEGLLTYEMVPANTPNQPRFRCDIVGTLR